MFIAAFIMTLCTINELINSLLPGLKGNFSFRIISSLLTVFFIIINYRSYIKGDFDSLPTSGPATKIIIIRNYLLKIVKLIKKAIKKTYDYIYHNVSSDLIRVFLPNSQDQEHLIKKLTNIMMICIIIFII